MPDVSPSRFACLCRLTLDALLFTAALAMAGCAWSSTPPPGFSSSHHKYQQEQSAPSQSEP